MLRKGQTKRTKWTPHFRANVRKDIGQVLVCWFVKAVGSLVDTRLQTFVMDIVTKKRSINLLIAYLEKYDGQDKC